MLWILSVWIGILFQHETEQEDTLYKLMGN